MNYIIYLTVNLRNGRIYIGAHATKNMDDGYIGSGKALKMAIAKYGRNSFYCFVLSTHKSREDMYAEEAKLVTGEFARSRHTYNIVIGGMGGGGWGRPRSDETKQKISESLSGENHPQYGKTQSLEYVEKRVSKLRGRKRPQHVIDAVSKANKGEGNGMFKGFHVTPWGAFPSAQLAAEACPEDVSSISIGKWCTIRNNTVIRPCSASRSTYLIKDNIGKTYAELGFGFLKTRRGHHENTNHKH